MIHFSPFLNTIAAIYIYFKSILLMNIPKIMTYHSMAFYQVGVPVDNKNDQKVSFT